MRLQMLVVAFLALAAAVHGSRFRPFLKTNCYQGKGIGVNYGTLFSEVRKSPHLLNGLQIITEFLNICDMRDCAYECGNASPCAAFALGADSCILLSSDPFGPNPYIYSSGDHFFVYKGVTLSVLAYRVTSGVGGDAIIRYNDNSYVSSDAETKAAVDLRAPITQTYKSALLDQWNTFNVVGVDLGFKRPDGTLGKVTFNAENSTSKYTWMVQSELLSSPWYDLNLNTTVHDFGVFGPLNVARRFYIMTHYSCPWDILYLTLLTPSGDRCPWAKTGVYKNPEILYSPNDKGYNVNNQKPGRATDFVMVMKLRID